MPLNTVVTLLPTPTDREGTAGPGGHRGGGPNLRTAIQTFGVPDDLDPPGEQLAFPMPGDEPEMNWGPYAVAIHLWEQVTGRLAPAPTEPGRNGQPRLSVPFTEWMMGLPDGWVSGHGLPRNAVLRMLGNGVVPQQAAEAFLNLGIREAFP